MRQHIRRREFCKRAALGAAGAWLAPRALWGQAPAAASATVISVRGKDVANMLELGMARLGGLSAFLKPGGKVTLKVNAAWASEPAAGGNTDPNLAAAFVRMARAAGAADVALPENTCSSHKVSFEMSGIGPAVAAVGGRLYYPTDADYETVELPGAKNLKTAAIVRDVLHCDLLVNMPVAKSHGSATLTIGMKNWMGSVQDRKVWHRDNLHQCIADFSARIKPGLTIVDATRIMVTNGPRGPGKLEYPEQILIGTDPVATDVVAAALFGKTPADVAHLRLAAEMGLGCGDLAKIEVVRLTA